MPLTPSKYIDTSFIPDTPEPSVGYNLKKATSLLAETYNCPDKVDMVNAEANHLAQVELLKLYKDSALEKIEQLKKCKADLGLKIRRNEINQRELQQFLNVPIQIARLKQHIKFLDQQSEPLKYIEFEGSVSRIYWLNWLFEHPLEWLVKLYAYRQLSTHFKTDTLTAILADKSKDKSAEKLAAELAAQLSVEYISLTEYRRFHSSIRFKLFDDGKRTDPLNLVLSTLDNLDDEATTKHQEATEGTFQRFASQVKEEYKKAVKPQVLPCSITWHQIDTPNLDYLLSLGLINTLINDTLKHAKVRDLNILEATSVAHDVAFELERKTITTKQILGIYNALNELARTFPIEDQDKVLKPLYAKLASEKVFNKLILIHPERLKAIYEHAVQYYIRYYTADFKKAKNFTDLAEKLKQAENIIDVWDDNNHRTTVLTAIKKIASERIKELGEEALLQKQLANPRADASDIMQQITETFKNISPPPVLDEMKVKAQVDAQIAWDKFKTALVKKLLDEATTSKQVRGILEKYKPISAQNEVLKHAAQRQWKIFKIAVPEVDINILDPVQAITQAPYLSPASLAKMKQHWLGLDPITNPNEIDEIDAAILSQVRYDNFQLLQRLRIVCGIDISQLKPDGSSIWNNVVNTVVSTPLITENSAFVYYNPVVLEQLKKLIPNATVQQKSVIEDALREFFPNEKVTWPDPLKPDNQPLIIKNSATPIRTNTSQLLDVFIVKQEKLGRIDCVSALMDNPRLDLGSWTNFMQTNWFGENISEVNKKILANKSADPEKLLLQKLRIFCDIRMEKPDSTVLQTKINSSSLTAQQLNILLQAVRMYFPKDVQLNSDVKNKIKTVLSIRHDRVLNLTLEIACLAKDVPALESFFDNLNISVNQANNNSALKKNILKTLCDALRSETNIKNIYLLFDLLAPNTPSQNAQAKVLKQTIKSLGVWDQALPILKARAAALRAESATPAVGEDLAIEQRLFATHTNSRSSGPTTTARLLLKDLNEPWQYTSWKLFKEKSKPATPAAFFTDRFTHLIRPYSK